MVRIKNWTRAANAVEILSEYCAPRVLSKLLGITRHEAAAQLLPIAHPTIIGSVLTVKWWKVLEGMGGVRMEVEKTHAEAEEKYRQRWARYQEKMGEVRMGQRARVPKRPQRFAHRFLTVAEFLRRNPRGTIVMCVNGHTLLARHGEVIADTKRSQSKRARVIYAYMMPETLKDLARTIH